MKKEWFEPGADGKSPFEREYYNHRESGTIAGNAISAAFRALLAVENCGHTVDAKDAEIAELRAEVERLKSECSEQQRYVLDLESAISRKETRIKVLEVANDSLTQYSSNLTAERDALQASLRDEQAKRASIEAELAACRESRDALQARIDAGVRVWDKWKQECGKLWLWAFPGATASQAWSDVCDALDRQPLDHIVEPNKMVDERRRTPGTRADRRAS